MKLNLPNRLTLLRIILVPLCMYFILFSAGGETVSRIIAGVVFLITALTDLVDGKIARVYQKGGESVSNAAKLAAKETGFKKSDIYKELI